MPRDRKPEPAGDYEVGYRRPPAHSRFKPGQSGNPRGRKKGARNLKSVLEEELFRPIAVEEGGKRRIRPVIAVVARQAMAKAAKGEVRALMPLIPLLQRAGLIAGDEIPEVAAQLPLTADEEADLYAALAHGRSERPAADAGQPEMDAGEEPR